jgi:hypothetical protein
MKEVASEIEGPFLKNHLPWKVSTPVLNKVLYQVEKQVSEQVWRQVSAQIQEAVYERSK